MNAARLAQSVFRHGVQRSLSLLPMNVSSFVYRQIKGVCRDLGGREGPRQMVNLRTGGRMLLNLADGQQRHTYYSRLYEYPYIACLKKHFVRSGDHVIDVGANVGFYTIWCALQVGETGSVSAFEPNPRAYAMLEENVALNGLKNVKMFPVALTDTDGTVRMETRFDDLALSRIVTSASGKDVMDVPARRLDAVFSSSPPPRVAFIKIDAEGVEPSVLKGAERILEKRPVLLIEVDERRLGSAGGSEDALLGQLKGYGYTPFRLGRTGRLSAFRKSAGRAVRDNLFFVPQERPLE